MKDQKITCRHHDVSFSYKGGGAYVTAYYKPELEAFASATTWSPKFYKWDWLILGSDVSPGGTFDGFWIKLHASGLLLLSNLFQCLFSKVGEGQDFAPDLAGGHSISVARWFEIRMASDAHIVGWLHGARKLAVEFSNQCEFQNELICSIQ